MSVKKEPRARKPRRPLAPVVALPGCSRPEDALSRLHELLANEDKPKGIIVITLEGNGDVDARVFGRLDRQHVTWAAARLMVDAAQMEADE